MVVPLCPTLIFVFTPTDMCYPHRVSSHSHEWRARYCPRAVRRRSFPPCRRCTVATGAPLTDGVVPCDIDSEGTNGTV